MTDAGSTTVHALPYPGDGTRVDVAAHIKDLADRLEAVLNAHIPGTDPHPQYLTAAEIPSNLVASSGASKKIAAGLESTTISSVIAVGGTSAARAVAFPTSLFSVAPIVVCSMQTVVGGSGLWVPRAANVTASGFDLYFYNLGNTASGSGATAIASWIAFNRTD